MRSMLLAVLAVAAAAEEPLPNLRFSGFGTLGFAGTSTSSAGFRRDNAQTFGAAAIDQVTGNVDTRIGLQLSSQLSENLLATLQVLSKDNYENSYKPSISVACLTWIPTANLQVRTGILQFEILPSGDFSNIGYGYLWVRPPVEALANTGSGRTVGLDVVRSFPLGPGSQLQLEAYGGWIYDKLPGSKKDVWDLTGGQTWTGAARFQHGNLKIRTSYSDVRLPRTLPSDYDAFQQGFHQFAALLQNPQLDQVADQLKVVGAHVRQLQLGAAWESGPYQLQGIYNHRNCTNGLLFPNLSSGFLSFGYRIGQVVPYAVYARATSGRPARPEVGNLGSLPAIFGPVAVAGRYEVAALDYMRTTGTSDQYTYSAGLRWDFRDGCALKAQADRIHANPGSGGPVVNLAPVPNPTMWDGRMTVLSVTLDFIFGGGR